MVSASSWLAPSTVNTEPGVGPPLLVYPGWGYERLYSLSKYFTAHGMLDTVKLLPSQWALIGPSVKGRIPRQQARNHLRMSRGRWLLWRRWGRGQC